MTQSLITFQNEIVFQYGWDRNTKRVLKTCSLREVASAISAMSQFLGIQSEKSLFLRPIL